MDEKACSPPSSAPTTGPAGVAKATVPGGVAKENGVKEPNPFGAAGLREPLSVDKGITETSGYENTQYTVYRYSIYCRNSQSFDRKHEERCDLQLQYSLQLDTKC